MSGNLVLDVDGVLLHPGGLTDAEKEEMREDGFDIDTFAEIKQDYEEDLHLGEYSFGKIVNEYNRETGQTLSLHDVFNIIFDNIRVNDDLVEYCKDSEANVSIVCNTCKAQSVFLKKHLDVNEWTHKRMYSYKYRAVKEEPRIYERLLAKLEADPDDCVFVDDEQEYVETAKDVGLHGFVYENNEQLFDELPARLG